MVILIHTAGKTYNDSFGTETVTWLKGLFVNALPRFAVPCFLMITGVFALPRRYSFRKARQSIFRVLIPLVFWSVMNIVFARAGDWKAMLADLARMPFRRVDNSLWYVYQLVWLYLAMCFWSILWDNTEKKQRWAFVGATLTVPGVLTHLEEILYLNTNEYLPFGEINPMLCYVGMLFLGRLLYDFSKQNEKKKVIAIGIGLTVGGFALMTVSSIIVSLTLQHSVHTFF